MHSKCNLRSLIWLATAAIIVSIRAETIKFVVTGDNRNYLGFADIEKQIQKIAGTNLQFQIVPGDADPPADTRAQIDAVFGKEFPCHLAAGNHDLDSLPFLHDYFDRHLNRRVKRGPAGTSRTTYSFDAGSVHIVILNMYWDGTQAPDSEKKSEGTVVPALREWLTDDLKASKLPWKIVVAHLPAYPQPDKDWGDARHIGGSLDKYPSDRDAFWKILEENGATAFICGHTHRYSKYQPAGSRVWQIDSGQARGDEGWKYDTFIIATADGKRIEFDAYRNLKERGKFEVTDTLSLAAPNKDR
jgi:hypothetical protein